MDDVHGLLAAHLEETFCCFLDEQSKALEPGDAWAQVGAARLAAELWWNLDGAESPTALRLLPLLARELEPASTRCGPVGGGAPAGWLPAGLVWTWRCSLLSNHSGQGITSHLPPLPPSPLQRPAALAVCHHAPGGGTGAAADRRPGQPGRPAGLPAEPV